MKDLFLKWNAGECPIINGVMFSDGRYYPVKPIDAPRSSRPIRLVYGQAESLEGVDKFQWASVGILCEATDIRTQSRVVAGEGSMGSDGVIALFGPTGALRWVAFFDFSNSFERVWFDGVNIMAENNLMEVWQFHLDQPWEIVVG